MNRLKLGLLADHQHPELDPWNPQPETDPDHKQISPPALALEHSIFLPVHFESGYAYPVVLWLHDRAGDHSQLPRVMPEISERNFLGVAIRGTCHWGSGYTWDQSGTGIEATANQVVDALDYLQTRFRVNRQRVFVAGTGCGGTMAYRLAFNQPQLFCGVGSLNGALPDNHVPLLNLRACRKVPVFWAHGRNSSELPESRLCQQLKLLHIGGFDVTLRQYPCRDLIQRQPLSDFNTWMMEQIANQPDSRIVL